MNPAATKPAPRCILVRYKVAPERVADNERYVRAVFAQLDRERPAGIRYATFAAEDGVFVHIAQIDRADADNPLQALAAFRAFTAEIKERCTEPPVATPVAAIGSYRWLEQ